MGIKKDFWRIKMAVINRLNQNVKKGGFITVIIIGGLIVAFITFLFIYLSISNYKDEASSLFSEAEIKLKDFDKQNIYSKQEMEKDLIDILDKVIIRYPNSTSAMRSLFYKGYIHYYTLKFDEAINELNIFVNKYSNSYLVNKANYLLSYCYSDSNKIDDAINTLKVFETRLKDSYFTPLAFFRIGNLYEIKGDKSNAIKYYQQIVDKYSKSSQKNIALKKLIILKNDIIL